MEQEHVVLTEDEDLYPKLMELKWSVDQYKDILIPCLGGLHIAKNFLGVLGRHMVESDLCELWVECDALGANAASSECDIRQRLCLCNANTQTHIAGLVAISTPTTECTPGLC